MAELRIHGKWGGPGEEETARFLEKNLPKSWTIDANVYLPNEDHDDVDLVVTGDNFVFLVENKHWGPILLIGEAMWEVRKAPGQKHGGGFTSKSPMGTLAQKARKATAIIREAVPPGAQILKQKVVDRLLVLSHPNLSLHGQIADISRLAMLKDAAAQLQELDSRQQTDLASHRSQIVKAIAGLPARADEITELGAYSVSRKLDGLGLARRFLAEHNYTGESVVLYCYSDPDSEEEERHQTRESEVMARLEGLQRTWTSHPPFVAPDWGWFIRPQVRPDGSKSLSQLQVAVAIRDFGPNPLRGLVRESFEALSQIHASGVIHRALSPSRVWLGRSQRVLFSDFFHARIDDKKTLIPVPVDKGAKPYAAPESAEDSHAATEASDVFSLGLIFIRWIQAELSVDDDDALTGDQELSALLQSSTNPSREERPSAAEVVAVLKSLGASETEDLEGGSEGHAIPSQLDAFEVGQFVGRFKLEEALGEGGAATSWRAYDTHEERMVVVRRLKHAREFERLLGDPPFKRIANRFCQGHINLEQKPEPGLHIVSYIEGQTLEQRHKSRPFGVEEIRSVACNLFSLLDGAFHKQGVVHGDISSRNILVNEDLEVFLIDLASVAEIGDAAPSATPRYKAPELRVEGGTISAQSDIYSAGAVLIDLMLSRPPYEGSPTSPNAGKLVRKPTNDEVALWGRDGEALLKILFTSVIPDVSMRPAYADELARRIKLQRAPEAESLPEINASENVNETVNELRQLFVDSKLGNLGMLALGGPFSKQTYVQTMLDSSLLPSLLDGAFELVLITGNPGDGKTTFLNALRGEVEKLGGSTLEENQAVWSGSLNEMSFTAVMDASESFDGKGSDEVLRAAMQPKGKSSRHVTVVAMNDGRLRQFVGDFEDEIAGLREAWESASGATNSGPVVIVDLKNRALVSQREEGLGLRALDSLVAKNLWEERGCGDCSAKGVCPILRNVRFLRSDGRSGFQRLTLMSHLSSERRATLRDFRSAIAYSVTKDMGCDEIHSARADDLPIGHDPALASWNLVFDNNSGDKLLNDWRRFDPTHSISPAFLREVVEASSDADVDLFDTDELGGLVRRHFLSENLTDKSLAASLGNYRHLVPFLRFVMDHADGENLKVRLLEGLSKLSGIFLQDQDGLRVASQRVDPLWTLIKSIGSDQFSLLARSLPTSGIEFLPDSAVLAHDGLGAELRVTLDMAEVLLRAADGELFGDTDSLALRQQALAFVERVAQSRGDKATLVSPSGEQFKIESRNGRIEMVNPR
jgi:serine/threonine protein kinase